MASTPHHIFLVSDATGETMTNVVRACLAQFKNVPVSQHRWWFVRTPEHVDRLLADIKKTPGLVIFTLVDQEIRYRMEEACHELGVPMISLLDPVLEAMAKMFDIDRLHEPGLQHILDEGYFHRIDAMHFAMALDDGQSVDRLKEADVILVGVSRTSKTPTCMYLANKGVKAANVPLVPGVDPPQILMNMKNKLIVGLTCDPRSLSDIRLNRLRFMHRGETTDYADPEAVAHELVAAKRLFHRMGWPTLDVSRRSIEEVAATIMQKLAVRQLEQETANSADGNAA